MKAMGTIVGLSSLMSAYVAALLGAVAIRVVGPYLAMALQMYTGNTEPVHPHLRWPYAAMFVLLLLPTPFLYTKRVALASVAAVPVALLPLWQLWRLYEAAGAGYVRP